MGGAATAWEIFAELGIKIEEHPIHLEVDLSKLVEVSAPSSESGESDEESSS